MNTWPGGKHHPMTQAEHDAWNAYNCPGTRQLCVNCGEETGQCEDDDLYLENIFDRYDTLGPLCKVCYQNMDISEGG